jgi:glycosyltransferase involved in cell wall biosynthesis
VGGVEVFVHRLALSLANSGNDVEVISFTDPPEGAPYTHRYLFRRLQFLKKPIFRLWLLPLALNLADFRRYDVLHFHGDDWFYFPRAVPTIRTFYGSARYESRAATNRKRKIAQLLVYRFEKLSAILADFVIGVGAEAIELYKADVAGKLFISNSTFFPAEKSKSPTFVFIGSWKGRKRGQFVAEQFLKNILPHAPDAKLFMASDNVPVCDAIIDMQHPSDAALAKAVREAWGLLSASTYEGFGIPYLEAITSGTVVVTTRNPGAEFVLDNGSCGFIVADQDFAKAVLAIIENAELRREYEALGLARAAVFSEANVIAEHLNYYRTAIERFHKKPGKK